MAARRVTKSAIDWAKIVEKVPENQKHYFQAFKSKSDGYLRKAFSLPENLPAINWDYYKTRGLPAGLLENFQKEYAAVKIAYPKENISPQIDEQERESSKTIAEFIGESNQRIAELNKELKLWEELLPYEYMTMNDYGEAFPDEVYDPLNHPDRHPFGSDIAPDEVSLEFPEEKH